MLVSRALLFTRVRAPSLLRSPSSPFSSSAALASRRNRLIADGTGHPAPPPPPGAPPNWRRPVHKPIPHLTALQSHSKLFQTRTRWIAHTLADGHYIPRNLLYKLLKHRQIPPETFALWVDVLVRRDPIYALERLRLLESAQQELQATDKEDDETPSCPDWLYLALPGMVKSPTHAPYLASQILSLRFSQLAENNRGLFVARCIQHFLRARHYVALRETVEWLAYTSPSTSPSLAITSPRSFSRILTALASDHTRATQHSSAPSELVHALADLVLATLKARRVPRTLETWLPLFLPKLIPQDPDKAMRLAVDMAQAGFAPHRPVLHQVMKVFARRGESRTVEVLMEEIRAVKEGRREVNAATVARGEVRLNRLGKGPAAIEQEEEDAMLEDDEDGNEAEKDRSGEEELATLEELVSPAAVKGREDIPSPAYFSELLPHPRDTPTRSRRSSVQTAPTSSSTDVPTLTRSRRSSVQTAPTSSSIDVPALDVSQPAEPLDAPLSPSIYSTTRLSDPSVALGYIEQLRSYAESSARGANFPRPPPVLDGVSWSALFHSIASQTSAVSSSLLLAILRKFESASGTSRSIYSPPRPTLRIYTIILRSLLLRNDSRLALHLWRSLEARGWQPDSTMLDVVVRAFCAINRDGLALRILQHYGHRPGVDDPSLLVSLRAPNPAPNEPRRRHSVRLDIVPFNSLLKHLSRQGRYDEAYRLYTSLEKTYHVRPDAATVSLMLDTARYASAAAGKGWGPGFEDLSSLSLLGGGGGEDEGRGGNAKGRFGVALDDRWDGVEAAKKMERFLWDEVLEGNWQDAELENPLQGGGALAEWFSGRLGRSARLSNGSGASVDDRRLTPPPDWRPFASTLSPLPPTYPHLYPNDRVFRSLIQLIGYHSSIRSIPLVLAWMRHLHIEPSRWTLCIALMYVEGEAAIGAKAVKRWREWLGEWLGEERVPSQEEIAWMRRGGKEAGRPELR
ncbi:hypothetical protein JCM5296_004999 [Sporobolomyces johnsonii]